MKSSLDTARTAGIARKARWTLLCTLALVLFLPGLAARAGGDDLSAGNKACLKCHDKEGESKVLGNGEKLSLHISATGYVASMHKDTDCEDCHDSIDAKTHGKDKTPLASRREFALSMKDACLTCHKKKAQEYGDSVHAAMVADGSTKAPLCSDCHDPHTQQSVKIVQPIAATPCARCHEGIFKAYAADVHGQERAAKGKAAPLCADCHQAHAVKAASLDARIKDACFSCHKDAVALHRDWLPNAAHHFEAVSCPACHAPDAERRVNLRMYDAKGQNALVEKSGVPKFERMAKAADTSNMGLDERALWSMLKELSGDGVEANTILRGRLEVRSGREAHQISVKSRAIKDCNVCHRQGAAAFQSVTLTIAGPDGRPLRHGVQKDVLNSLTSMDSVRGFYAIGATRIGLLDTLLVLVVLGAISVPVVHMTIKWLFRRVRARVEAERAAAASGETGGPTSG